MARTNRFWGPFLTGAVALLPLLAVFAVAGYLEGAVAGTWLAGRAFYVPGMGIVAAVAAIYAFGLLLSTVAGRWLWRRLDARLARVPTVGLLYRTLRQLLGHEAGEQGLFQRVVLVQADVGEEIAFVTRESEAGGPLWVFVPAAPNPAAGRLLAVAPERVRPLDMTVAQGVRHIVSLGKV